MTLVAVVTSSTMNRTRYQKLASKSNSSRRFSQALIWQATRLLCHRSNQRSQPTFRHQARHVTRTKTVSIAVWTLLGPWFVREARQRRTSCPLPKSSTASCPTLSTRSSGILKSKKRIERSKILYNIMKLTLSNQVYQLQLIVLYQKKLVTKQMNSLNRFRGKSMP